MLHLGELLRAWADLQSQATEDVREAYMIPGAKRVTTGTRRVLTGRAHYAAYYSLGLSAPPWPGREKLFFADFARGGLHAAFGGWATELTARRSAPGQPP